jgi:hypothetical protein
MHVTWLKQEDRVPSLVADTDVPYKAAGLVAAVEKLSFSSARQLT